MNLAQPAIDALNYEMFNGNPIPINAVLAGLGFIFGVLLVGFVWVQGKKVQKKQALEDAEFERRRMVPESIAESEFED